jgi:MYXO-CTERM domain-containing protein
MGWADLGEAAPVEAAVEALLEKLRRAATDPKPAARALDALVMEPVRRLLGETRQVFLSPDGALNLVPFAALRDEEGHYLIERYAFTYLTSGRDLVRFGASSPAHEGPVVVAAPDFGAVPKATPGRAAAAAKGRRSADMGAGAWKPLPFAAEEGRALSQQLPGARIFIGAQATENAIKALRSPTLLHIATHGFFLPDQPELRAPSSFNDMSFSSPELRGGARRALPYAENPLLRSGLIFAGANRGQSGNDDGVLTALEASQLDLTGTELVVLSACETGVGDAPSGEGVYGLRRALVIAGAETQVMSLWKVSDEATREQMQAYYGRLLKGGGRSDAMRQVQLAMLSDPQRAHPYFWASFIVSGNPAALDGNKAAPQEVGRVAPGARGCGCEVGVKGRRGTAGWMLGVAALAWARLRRRRRE